MKILLVNYRYFVSGGPERYMFNLMDCLKANGHETVPFSIHYRKNQSSEYSSHFVSPLAGEDAITFDQHRWTPNSLVKTLQRSFYSREVEQAISRLADGTRPDAAYILHFLRKLSPAVLVGLKKHDIPIVVRISDFLWVCPAIHCLRNNKPCTLCARGNLWHSVKYRCVQHSLGASLVNLLAARYHKWRHYFDLIDHFVVTNEFTHKVMIEAGWPPDKLVLLHTFANPQCFTDTPITKAFPGHILFCGQLEPHKGPDLLLRAYARARQETTGEVPRLKFAAQDDGAFAETCHRLASKLGIADQVDFLGFVEEDMLHQLYREALFTVVPSICFENLPNALIESCAAGTAVLGAAESSLAPFIEDKRTGRLFQMGNEASLADTLRTSWEDPAWCVTAGQAAQKKASELFRMDRHREKLVELFSMLAKPNQEAVSDK